MKKALIAWFGVMSALTLSNASADECDSCYQGCFAFRDKAYPNNQIARAACYGGCGFACTHYVCP